MMQEFKHVTVLKEETILSVLPSEEATEPLVIVDGTLGGGGHAKALLTRLEQQNKDVIFIGYDKDPTAITWCQSFLPSSEKIKLFLFKKSFSSLYQDLKSLGLKSIHSFYADLGVSSPQLDLGHRGFSFSSEGPLDMRMGQEDGQTAKDLLSEATEASLEKIFRNYGEEPRAKKLAHAIVMDREAGTLSLESSLKFADYVKRVLCYHNSRTHPATKIFQALRIEVNRELEDIEDLLLFLPQIISNKGKVSFISFHSLEDRLVKKSFRAWEKGFLSADLYDAYDKREKHPFYQEPLPPSLGRETPRGGITPSEEELRGNHRSRSARLRTFHFDF